MDNMTLEEKLDYLAYHVHGWRLAKDRSTNELGWYDDQGDWICWESSYREGEVWNPYCRYHSDSYSVALEDGNRSIRSAMLRKGGELLIKCELPNITFVTFRLPKLDVGVTISRDHLPTAVADSAIWTVQTAIRLYGVPNTWRRG